MTPCSRHRPFLRGLEGRGLVGLEELLGCNFYRKRGYSVEVIGEKIERLEIPKFAFRSDDE